jgi:WD40 repeat protein
VARATKTDRDPINGTSACGAVPPRSAIAESIPIGGPPGWVAFDGYKITGKLGAGGMGTVWRAIQLATRREVALKLLNINASVSGRAKRRFEREVELASRLEHPGIARVYDSGINDGSYFYAMELIEGEALDEFVGRRHLDQRGVLALMSSICRAIQYAHQKGVIHRDLKPSNILVDISGNAHVVDFGLGKLQPEQAALETISIMGQWAGTPAYMSPEQAAGESDDIDTRTDVYTLGVILYQLMTGRLPHDTSGGHLAILQRVVRDEIIRPRKFSAVIDRELEAVILKATAKHPDDRYSSAAALADDIDNYLHGDPLTARPATAIYFLKRKLAKHWLPLSLAASLVAGLVGVVVYASVRVGQERDVAIAATEQEKSLLRESKLALAESLLSTADLQQADGQWPDAGDKYLEAYRMQQAEGGETTSFSLALFQNSRSLPSEVTECTPAAKLAAPPVGVFFDPDGRTAWEQLANGVVESFDLVTGRQTGSIGVPITQGSVFAVAENPSGDSLCRIVRRVGSLGTSGEIQTINLRTGAIARRQIRQDFVGVLQTIAPYGKNVMAVLVGPSPPSSPSADVWMIPLAAAGKPLVLSVPTGAMLTALACSPDFRTIAVGDRQGRISYYAASSNVEATSTDSGNQLFDATTLGAINCMAYAPDGSGVLAGDVRGDVVFASATPSSQLRRLGIGDWPVQLLAVSHDSRLGLTADSLGFIDLWDIVSGSRLRAYNAGGRIAAMQLSNDDRELMAATMNGTIHVWPVDLAQQTIFCHSPAPVEHIAVSPDNLLVAIAGRQFVIVYDAATHRMLKQLEFVGDVTSVTFSTDGCMLDAATDRGEIIQTAICSPADKSASLAVNEAAANADLLAPADTTGKPHSIWLSAASNSAIDLTEDGAVLFDLSNKTRVIVKSGGLAQCAGVSADGSKLLVLPRNNGWRRSLDLYDFTSKSLRVVMLDQYPVVSTIAISNDGNTAFVALEKGGIRAIDLASRHQIWESATFQRFIRCLKLSPSGTTLLSAAEDGTLRLRDALDGHPLRSVADGLNPISTIAFSPDGSLIFSNGAPDNGVFVWDLSLAIREREDEHRANQARLDLAANPSDVPAAAELVEWYLSRGMSNWARSLLDQGQMDSRIGLPAAECRWQVHDDATAALDFKSLIRRSDAHAPDEYLRACWYAASTPQ